MEGHARYRDLVEALSQVVYEVDTTGRITYVNRVAEEKFGLTKQVLERGIRVGQLLIPEDRERGADNIRRVIAGETVGTNEYTVRAPNGRVVPVVIDSRPIVEEGRVVGLRGVVIDISRQRELDEELQEANRLASIGTLAAGLAHEINNPLTSVLGNIQVLDGLLGEIAGDIAPTRAAMLRELFDDLLTAVSRVATITRDLGVLARADDGPSEPVLIDNSIEQAMGIARNQVTHSATMRRFGATGLRVEGREHRLVQLFTNLLVNAAQQLPSSTVTGRRHEIVVSASADGDFVEVEVRDNGPGIAPQLLPRIFEPFVTGRPQAGTGMGLAICRRIVQSLGGEIRARNLEEGGASFQVRLQASRQPVPSARVGEAVDLRGVTVLLVDDDASVRLVLERILAGATVETASGGSEALQRLQSADFDVVLCDLMMPDIGGHEVYRELSAARPEQARRFVFITGGAFKPETANFLRTVEVPVVSKPVLRDELRQLVHRVARPH